MIRTDLFRGCAILWLIAVSGVASAAPGQNERYQIFHYEELDAVVDHAARSPSGQTTLRFQAHGRDFSIRLADNRRLISGLTDEARARILAEIEIYRGELEGAPDSWARLTRRGTQWQGLIWDGYEFFVIEPGQIALASRSATASTEKSGSIIYRLADTDAELSDLVIEVPESMKAEAALSATNGGEQALAMTNAATKRIDVAAIGDFEYTNSVIGDGQVEIVTFMNAVDGIFDSQVDIQINVVELRTFPQDNDPFSGTSEPIDLLNEVGDYKSSDPILRNLGIVHLFTGVNLDGTTIGIAFLSSICSQQAGVSLSQATNVQGPVHLTAAHEIGHNFGAPHDGDSSGACGSVVGNFLMSPSLNGSDQFSACSVTEMQQVIATASCLSNIIPGDVQSTIPVDPVNALTGPTFNHEVNIENIGGSSMNNVTLDIGYPTGIRVMQASLDGGNCQVPTTTTVTCQRTTLNAMTVATATISVSGSAPGAYPFTVSASADNDGDPTNNDSNGTINLTAAADVSIDIVLADEFVLNSGSTSATVTVQNNGPQSAENVTATISFHDSLTVSPGQVFPSCVAVNANQGLDCSFGDISSAPQQEQQFVVMLDASVSASQTILIDGQVSSDTADFDLTNNSDSESISIGGRFADVMVTVSNPSTTLLIGNTGNAVLTLNNNGPNSAGIAILTVTSSPGLGSLGVNASIPCNTSNNSVTCTASDFSGSQNITISYVATAAGNSTIQAVAQVTGADDIDTSQSNNNASFSVAVGSPPSSGGGGGGGGATGVVYTAVLLIMLLIRRRVV